MTTNGASTNGSGSPSAKAIQSAPVGDGASNGANGADDRRDTNVKKDSEASSTANTDPGLKYYRMRQSGNTPEDVSSSLRYAYPYAIL